jgi:hypothetical protein
MIWIGVDPGKSGGLAFIQNLNGRDGEQLYIDLVPMPASERELLDVLEPSTTAGQQVKAVLEHVWSTPGQGGAWKFGRQVGHCEMALTAARIPFDQVLPRTWQKALGISYRKGLTDTQKKNITKRRAQQLFPDLVITHATADALLMAEYCRRIQRGQHGEEGSQAKGGQRPRAQRGESREEFERDRAGETGERLAAQGRRAPSDAQGQRPRKRSNVPGAGQPQGRGPDAPRESLRR